MSGKFFRQRFSFHRAKARRDELSIDAQVFGTQKIRLRFCAGQKKQNRSIPFINLGQVLLGYKLKPSLDTRMLKRFHIFLRTIKAKFIVEHGWCANLSSRLQDPKLPISGCYHGQSFQQH